MFWLTGLAGTGKSTIARTIARTYSERRLGASFFFSRGGGDVGHAGKFVTTLALQLVSSIPFLRQHVCDAVREHNDIASRSLREQWQKLILRPLLKLDGSNIQAYILVVDALDECENEDDIQTIVHLLAGIGSLEKVHLRVFLASRPEIPIRSGFCQIQSGAHREFMLHNISSPIIDHDIYVFFSYNFQLMTKERSLGTNWPGEDTIRTLVQCAGESFLWAATACRFIHEGKRFAAKRLATILEGSKSAVAEPEKHLNEIYITVLTNSISSSFDDEEKEESYSMLRLILGTIVTLFSQLSVYSLSILLCLKEEDVHQTLDDLHSVLDVPKNQSHPLRLHHPSLRDFLLDKKRCHDSNFWVNEKQAHQNLADKCIWLMSTFLRQDICEFNAPGVLVADIERIRVDQHLAPEVQYACLYWVQHIQKAGTKVQDDDQVHQFLQKHLLHWFEALGWMNRISEGIYAVTTLESMTAVSELFYD